MSAYAQSRRRSVMSTSENASVATASLATASLAASALATQSAAMENAWAAPHPRTYFVGGFKVQHVRDTLGQSRWSCDCAEFNDSILQGAAEPRCSHTQRIAESAELDRLLRTPGLILPTACY
jgi:hypothetical protein